MLKEKYISAEFEISQKLLFKLSLSFAKQIIKNWLKENVIWKYYYNVIKWNTYPSELSKDWDPDVQLNLLQCQRVLF